ncbi:MAG TPA: D-arabinono-1,4-lactone oxidase, partial [Gaiellaceae bacterium]|nr:D-arabinono-1,4-lactone oxidase [Gaiellaceae bacterium]
MSTWTNWVGNQSFTPAQRAAPTSEDEVATLVASAAQRGLPVRVAGAGHSFTPVVATDGLLLDLRGLGGIRSVDSARRRVVVGPSTTIGEFGEPLWAEGLALANQGDIVAQQIAGAISTATHGSGLRLGSFSAGVRRVRIVTSSGDVVEIGENDPARLHAAQVSVGMLGVITEVELEVAPAYRLRERIEHWTWEQAWGSFDELAQEHRHYSFFWMPSEDSAALYGLASSGESLADRCHVKIYDEVDDSTPDSDEPRRRVGPAHVIYPMVYEPNFHELEYFVPYEQGRDALAAMRELMLASLPASVFPMEVRTVGRDVAFLSHSYERDTVVISVSGTPGTDYDSYLRDVDRLLGAYDARVHWGKLHYLSREQLLDRYPRANDFIATRRALDPTGTFLNSHL